MKRLLTLAVATAIMGLTIDSAHARPDNPAIKNGNPCIEDVCINDELKDLDHIKWEDVIVSQEKSREFKAIGNPSSIKKMGYYFVRGYIDSKGIKELNRIKGFCERPYNLKAFYTDKKGRDVVVTFGFLPINNGKSQKFFVSKISQKLFNQSATPEQHEDLVNRKNKKYLKFGNYTDGTRPEVMIAGFNTTLLVISSQYIPETIKYSEYRKFPGCGGDVQIKL